MATAYTIKLTKVEGPDSTGRLKLFVDATAPGGFTWSKSYLFSATETVTIDKVKERILSDLKADLAIKDTATKLKSLVNQTYTITL